MKKLLSLLLSLMMLLSFACAEDAATGEGVEWVTVDFGDFTMDLKATDMLEQGEKTNNAVMAIIYPDFDPNATFYNNLNVVWSEENLAPSVKLLGAEAVGQMVLTGGESGLQAQKIATANATMLTAQAEGNELVVIYSIDADYSALGVDLATTLYFMQYYVMDAGLGTYTFTLTTASFEALEALSSYFDTLVFKTAEVAAE